MLLPRQKKPLILIIAILLFVSFASHSFKGIFTFRLNGLATPLQNNTKKGTSVLISNHNASFYGFLVNANGLFLDRVSAFNKALNVVRNQILSEQQAAINASNSNDDLLESRKPFEAVWGGDDNYLELLATRHRHILTLALPWQRSEPDKKTLVKSSGSQQPISRWSSLSDFSNLLVQRYYQWTGESPFCSLIESPDVMKHKYNVLFNRSCERDQTSAAARPQSISPMFLYPNSRPTVFFYTQTPPFVFHMHIHRDAVADENGDVFSGNTALLPFLCRTDSAGGSRFLPTTVLSLPIHNDVFTLTQMWGGAVFHRMVEVIPRIVPYIEFLLQNPDIRIQVPGSEGDQLSEILCILGLDKRRLVRGSVRGKIVYQPRPTACGTANLQESQLASKLYRDYIARTFPDRKSARTGLLLIRRSGSRRFTEHQDIEAQLKSLAIEFGLTYELFPDNPTPSLADTMKLFNSAAMVVGPHGAALSNILFSEPGTYVVEGVCNEPHVNLCFQRLAHVLGHRWHGVLSRDGCEDIVNAPATAIIEAARKFLSSSNITKKP